MLPHLVFNSPSIHLFVLFTRYDDEIFQNFQKRFRNMQVIEICLLQSEFDLLYIG